MARLDYSQDWPALPDELLAIIASSMQDPSRGVLLHRSLMATKQVTKALMENRMPRGRKTMQQVSVSVQSSLILEAFTDVSAALYFSFYGLSKLL